MARSGRYSRLSANAHRFRLLPGRQNRLLLFPWFRCSDHTFGRDADAARVISHLPDGSMVALSLSASFFMQLFFPDISRFQDRTPHCLKLHSTSAGKAVPVDFPLHHVCLNTLASGLASHASVSRLLYVMGRDNVFPERVFGYVHPKWRTPALNVIMNQELSRCRRCSSI